jgi:hypothetical protein
VKNAAKIENSAPGANFVLFGYAAPLALRAFYLGGVEVQFCRCKVDRKPEVAAMAIGAGVAV